MQTGGGGGGCWGLLQDFYTPNLQIACPPQDKNLDKWTGAGQSPFPGSFKGERDFSLPSMRFILLLLYSSHQEKRRKRPKQRMVVKERLKKLLLLPCPVYLSADGKVGMLGFIMDVWPGIELVSQCTHQFNRKSSKTIHSRETKGDLSYSPLYDFSLNTLVQMRF